VILEFYFSCYEILMHTKGARGDTQIFRMFSIGEDSIYRINVSRNDFIENIFDRYILNLVMIL
jgi:hypothetical protein